MYLLFDTETTGLPAGGDDVHMLQLAWILQGRDHETRAHGNCIVLPEGWNIPDEIAKLTRIDHARAAVAGHPVDQVLSLFTAATYFPVTIVGHNLEFDCKVVAKECERLGWPDPLADKPRTCTMLASVDVCAIPSKKGGYKWPKLDELHTKLFGRPFEGAHDALADVRATAKCFWELRKLGKV